MDTGDTLRVGCYVVGDASDTMCVGCYVRIAIGDIWRFSCYVAVDGRDSWRVAIFGNDNVIQRDWTDCCLSGITQHALNAFSWTGVNRNSGKT